MRPLTLIAIGFTGLTLTACAAPNDYPTAESYCQDYMNKRVGTPDYDHCVTDERNRRADNNYYDRTYPSATGYPYPPYAVTNRDGDAVVTDPNAPVEETTTTTTTVQYKPYYRPY